MSPKIKELFSDDDIGETRDKFSFIEDFEGIPSSVKEFTKSDHLMSFLDENIDSAGQVGHTSKASLSGKPVRYSIYIPDQAVWILKYYTKENDIVLDPFMGRGTRSQMSLYMKRKYVGYDTCPDTIQLNHMLSHRNNFSSDDYTYIKGDGTLMKEYSEKKDCVDCVFTCPPYYDVEVYTGDEGDLSHMKDSEFEKQIGVMFKNVHRLIKPSNYEKEEFYPVIITVGSKRVGNRGLLDMDYVFQKLAKEAGLVLHDKLITKNRSPFGAFTFRRNYKKKFLQKAHETTLIFLKYK